MKLESFIRSSDLSVKAFAEKLGVDRTLIHKYISGERHPSSETMRRIVELTNSQVTPNDFFDLND